MVVCLDFLGNCAGVAGNEVGDGEPKLETTTEDAAYFLEFHRDHVNESKDNEYINSFCLPVYAVPLGQNPKRKAGRKGKRKRDEESQVEDEEKASRRSSRPASARIKRKASSQSGGSGGPRGKERRSRRATIKFEEEEEEEEDAFSVHDDSAGDTGIAENNVINGNGSSSTRSRRKKKKVVKDEVEEVAVRKGRLNYERDFAKYAGNYAYQEHLEVKMPPDYAMKLNGEGRIVRLKPSQLSGSQLKLRVGDFCASKKTESGLALFYCDREKHISKFCGLNGELIHPTKLFEAVRDNGGFEHICANNQWQIVRQQLGLKNTSSSGFNLRRAYEKYFFS